jgi:hypothetical protein
LGRAIETASGGTSANQIAAEPVTGEAGDAGINAWNSSASASLSEAVDAKDGGIDVAAGIRGGEEGSTAVSLAGILSFLSSRANLEILINVVIGPPASAEADIWKGHPEELVRGLSSLGGGSPAGNVCVVARVGGVFRQTDGLDGAVEDKGLREGDDGNIMLIGLIAIFRMNDPGHGAINLAVAD